jgi:glyoxylase-like metal-dependent hydrolase (beta-lactamase superfamily II)
MSTRRITRRVLLADLGKGVASALVLGACSTSATTSTVAAVSSSTATSFARTPTTTASSAPREAVPLAWERVDLSAVSVYVLVRSGEAAIVDTGVAGSESAIADGLTALGIEWNAVGHVILTHKHADHAGSISAVMSLATDANGYAGAGDIPSIDARRALTAVGDGDTVFGCSIIETPGHTPGHISVLDPGRVLFAGDALNGAGGGIVGPDPRYTLDMETAIRSVVKLGGFDFQAAVFGHGDPVTNRASTLVADLAEILDRGR